MRRWGWLLGLWALAAPVLAQEVPPPLRNWQDWVLHDVPQHACPFLANQGPGNVQCAWPGRLGVDAGKDGGRFSLDVHVDAPSWVTLPGDARSWPQQVAAGAKALAVLERGGEPSVWLEPGDYSIHGVLPWTSRPARLRVPASIGLVALNVDGAAVTRVERNGDQLTLGEAAAAQRAADALSLRVYRRLEDGLPSTLETHLQINVTGSAREQLLGPALPQGFVATALSSNLPARLESDGRLRIQLRPGQWTLDLTSRGTDVLKQVALKLPAEPWPRQEIWSYQDNTELRSTRVEGQPTDAAQAGVPDDWRELPAFALDDNQGLAIEQGTRGSEGGQGDQVQVQRQIWLDFDGRGLNVSDRLTGTLRKSQRLDVSAPWQLQRAAQGETPLLVTGGENGRSGVELRESQLNLSAGLRLPHGGSLPSGGWQLPLENIEATLHLPYGYRLLGASGADRSPDSWIAQWSLLDLFVVALIALLAGRLMGWPWALLAIAFLALSQHESGAPRWTLGVALALALLARALPEGKLRLGSRIGAGAVLALAVLWSLPFAATQMDYVLHPQLEQGEAMPVAVGWAAPKPAPSLDAMEPMDKAQARRQPAPEPAPAVEEASSEAVPEALPAPPAPPAPPYDANVSEGYAGKAKALSGIVVSASALPPGNRFSQQADTRNIIQAGHGEPGWNVGNNYRLGWSGPVTAEQTTRLVIAPSWLVRLLRFAMLVLLAALLARIVLRVFRPGDGGMPRWPFARAGAALLLIALVPQITHAQDALPNEALLQQLRQRLTEAPKCVPNCAAVAAAQIQANGDQIDVDLELHVGAPVAVPLPQADASLQLQSVGVDGHADAALAQRGAQTLVRIERGVHRLSLRYRAVAADTVSLRFALHPQRVAFAGQGWAVDGVDEGRALGDSLSLHRVRAGADGKEVTANSQAFPPYVTVQRVLVLGVDWTVETTVTRVAPSDGGFSLDLPLLPGEHPLGDDIRVHDGLIGVTFNGNQQEVSWTSRLDHADKLELKAPALGERAEYWEVQAAPMWHVDGDGVPASQNDGALAFRPLPGEALHLAVTQPKAVAGDSLAFDSVSLNSTVGDRATETTMKLQARSTRGGEHVIVLPAGAELLEARRDGQPLSLAVRDGKLSLPLLPGAHWFELRLREPHGIAAATRSAQLGLGASAANLYLGVKLPEDRWVLWTWGPTAGPAVLYWSQLVVLLLVAWLLARYAPTPLRFHHWLLLGLGFSAFAWSAYALVVVWLIALGLRARKAPPERLGAVGFNLLQIALAFFTVIALVVLISAVPKGLLGLPDMHVAGNGSTAWQLRWFADQTTDVLPRGGVFSVSLWAYKIAMLLWALWLANALIGWLRWGFEAWTREGYWRKGEPKPARPAAMPPELPPQQPERHDG
ncbi:hypothetical protein FHW84_004387 [Dyella sp. SG562]|uniref:hypothetical protein n=1 Tax=Dyella sp. SG562 TaxID=2587017 RepID=UPI0014205F61|nr:hypothetical protein [Dyella sp. SG562]NII75776.1 hypothetical protein [Dyella sp. SG562]